MNWGGLLSTYKAQTEGTDLYKLSLVEGVTMIPYPILDKLCYEILGMGFEDWQKRVDIDFPDDEIKRILKERYRNWSPNT